MLLLCMPWDIETVYNNACTVCSNSAGDTWHNKMAHIQKISAYFDATWRRHSTFYMQAALNIDNSVSRIGLYGTQLEKLWCLSHTETLHLWEWVAACDEESSGQHSFPLSLLTIIHKSSTLYMSRHSMLSGQVALVVRHCFKVACRVWV